LHSNIVYGQELGENFGKGMRINTFTSGSFQVRDIMDVPTITLSD